MAKSTSEDIGKVVTLLKDIQIRDFSSSLPYSVIFFYNGIEPFCMVTVNPCHTVSHHQFVSVWVRRYSVYPRFFPEVVYKSLEWTVSVLDAEEEETFVTCFGLEDFQSLDWVEDFFSERGYELAEFVKRSVLLDDPERFLPGGVLTVRVKMSYECRIGDEAVALEKFMEELWEFAVKPIRVDLDKKKQDVVQADSNSRAEEPVEISKVMPSVARFPKESTKVLKNAESIFKEIYLQERNIRRDFWMKEIVLMMEETFQELEDAMEFYAKCLQEGEKDTVEESYQEFIGSDFCPEFVKDMDLFQRLFSEVGLGSPIELDFGSLMKEPIGENEMRQKLGRILAMNKQLQLHWKNCKEVYKSAAEKTLVKSPEENTEDQHKCTLAEGIRELFLIYKETVIENQREKPDHLLFCVSRFLKVFSNVNRIISLRLYWQICVVMKKLAHRCSECSFTHDEEDMNDNATKDKPSTSTRVENEDESVAKSEEAFSTVKSLQVVEESKASEIWYFTIETSDQERFEIPFQTGTTTLGTLLCSASPVFDRMLETPMVEKSNRFLKMDDFESSTFSRFLSYLESGKVDVDTSLQECGELYQLAHKYQAEKLVLDCVGKIAQIMDHTNAEDVAEFSKFYEDDKLMSMVEDFRFRPRATMAAWGLTDLDVAPLSPDTTWAKSVKDVPIVEKAIQAVRPEEKYEFYE